MESSIFFKSKSQMTALQGQEIYTRLVYSGMEIYETSIIVNGGSWVRSIQCNIYHQRDYRELQESCDDIKTDITKQTFDQVYYHALHVFLSPEKFLPSLIFGNLVAVNPEPPKSSHISDFYPVNFDEIDYELLINFWIMKNDLKKLSCQNQNI